MSVIFRSDTAARWASENPLLCEGEPAFEYDTGKFKIGNGKDRYVDLPYQSEEGKQGPAGEKGASGPAGDPGSDTTLAIGTVQAGLVASATITGSPPHQTLNLVLPQSQSTGGGGGGGGGGSGEVPVITFTLQPTGKSVLEGEAITLEVLATSTGKGVIAYQWQATLGKGATWINLTGATQPKRSWNAGSDAPPGGTVDYRCIASLVSPTTSAVIAAQESNVASVRVSAQPSGQTIKVTKQPLPITVPEGGVAAFTVAATTSNPGTLYYSWERLAPGSSTWTGVAGNSGNTAYTLTLLAVDFDRDNGAQYRAKIRLRYQDNFVSETYSQGATLTISSGVPDSSGETVTGWLEADNSRTGYFRHDGFLDFWDENGNRSTNGTDWESTNNWFTKPGFSANPDWHWKPQVARGNGVFVSVSESDVSSDPIVAKISVDGKNWVTTSVSPSNGNQYGEYATVVFGKGLFVRYFFIRAQNPGPTYISFNSLSHSIDGLNWVSATGLDMSRFFAIHDGLQYFGDRTVFAPGGGPNIFTLSGGLYYSTDGKAWTKNIRWPDIGTGLPLPDRARCRLAFGYGGSNGWLLASATNLWYGPSLETLAPVSAPAPLAWDDVIGFEGKFYIVSKSTGLVYSTPATTPFKWTSIPLPGLRKGFRYFSSGIDANQKPILLVGGDDGLLTAAFA
jgi:hypothetical protein